MSKRVQPRRAERPPRNVARYAWPIGIALITIAVVSGIVLRSGSGRTSESVAMPPDVFLVTRENPTSPREPAPEGMVWIAGGEFSMGAADPRAADDNDVGMRATDDSRPVHRVYVDGFWMDKTEVTNAQFATFVKATGYVTVAERTPQPGSVVFSAPGHAVPLNDYFQWWLYVDGASWRHPL